MNEPAGVRLLRPRERVIERKWDGSDAAAALSATNRRTAERKDKNKIHSVNAPEVKCISKGKAHKRYEFGCKVSVAATSRGGWFVGARGASR